MQPPAALRGSKTTKKDPEIIIIVKENFGKLKYSFTSNMTNFEILKHLKC